MAIWWFILPLLYGVAAFAATRGTDGSLAICLYAFGILGLAYWVSLWRWRRGGYFSVARLTSVYVCVRFSCRLFNRRAT